MIIFANSNDAYPFIKLHGDGNVEVSVADGKDIEFYNETELSFKFENVGTLSTISGGDDTGDTFKILANTTDTYPFIQLEGDDYIELRTTNDIYFYEQAEQMFKFLLSGTTSLLYGGANTGDDLFIGANDNDICPMLKLWGDSGIDVLIKAGSIFDVATCTDETLFEIDSAAGHHHIEFHCLDAHDFVLENRTDDPGSPCIGQIWFRTDLV